MNSPVTKIKERLSIEDVVSTYIKLERSGNNLKARCPFHEEKTPSFFVSPSRGSYYCFGCSAKGDIFTFVEEFEGLDFKGALKLLADRAGVPIQGYNKEEESEKDRLLKAMEESTLFFIHNLKNNKEALEYLKSRGLKDQTIKEFRIGFAKLDWRELYSHLKIRGFSDKELEAAGLAKKTEKGMYDRFRGRIMFPIADSSGRVIAFSGRIFRDDGKSAKYLNSPETPIFSKSFVLYGLDKAKESIRKNNFSILVEGQMDLVLSHQAGWRNTVATSGTALSDAIVSKENVVSNLGLIHRLSNNIVLGFDGDPAGQSASSRAGRIALSLGMDVKVADLPPLSDPAELIARAGPDAWRLVIKNSKHIIEFLLERILKNVKDERKMGMEVKEKILPFVNALRSSIEQTHFLKKISEETGIPQKALEEDLKKVEKELKYETTMMRDSEEIESKKFRKDYILRRLLGIVIWQKTLPEKMIDSDNLLNEIAETLNIGPELVLNETKDSEEDLIFEAEIIYAGGNDLKKDAEELLKNLKEEYLKEELGRKMRELHTAEAAKDAGKSSQILKEYQLINDKLQNIKSGHFKK